MSINLALIFDLRSLPAGTSFSGKRQSVRRRSPKSLIDKLIDTTVDGLTQVSVTSVSVPGLVSANVEDDSEDTVQLVLINTVLTDT